MIANPGTMLSDGYLQHHWVAGLRLPQRALLFTTSRPPLCQRLYENEVNVEAYIEHLVQLNSLTLIIPSATNLLTIPALINIVTTGLS